ncbi:MAG: hypothetical protein EOO03_01415 [Chitinophagaceae bacterium]|nr:MAG: hypothetical protein EOO03_01415 [Chitinophagaceae bacterium]
MSSANTVAEVLQQQQEIIKWATAHQSRVGYFAVLYRRMTLAVEAAMAKQQFEDNVRMERLMVHFANFYLDAWNAYIKQQACCMAWRKVFEACNASNLVVLQHLILGINTHINLDLAKAAERTSPGDSIFDLQNDFEKINHIIAALSQDVQTCLEKVWWPLKTLTDIANKRHEAVLNFSIDNARKASWANAIALTLVEGSNKRHHLQCMEDMVIALSQKIMHPGWFTGMLLKPVIWMETKDVRKVIALLE